MPFFQRIWWLLPFSRFKTDEEKSASKRLAVIWFIYFIGMFWPLIWLFGWLEFEKHLAAFIAICLAMSVAVVLSHRTCLKLWPDLIIVADEDALLRRKGS